MNLPFIDFIWRVRGSIEIDPTGSAAETFGKLDDLFQTPGTSYSVDANQLTFTKKDPRSQDKMATYTKGTLKVVDKAGASHLAYDMTSKTLLFCFILPFFFVGVALLMKSAHISGLVFAGIFAFLYVAGRILEPWLIRNTFRSKLTERPFTEGNGSPAI